VTRLGGQAGPGREVRIRTRNVSSTAARQPGPRVDVQPVALPPLGQVRVPFVDGDVGAGLPQALGQAEPAEPAAGHRDPQGAHRSGSGGRTSCGRTRGARAASALAMAWRIHQVAYAESV